MCAYAIDAVIHDVDSTSFLKPTAVLIGDPAIETGCNMSPDASLKTDTGRIQVVAGANTRDVHMLRCLRQRQARVGADGEVGHRAVLSLQQERDPHPALAAEHGTLATSIERTTPVRQFRQATSS
jgi:hypothetical protein